MSTLLESALAQVALFFRHLLLLAVVCLLKLISGSCVNRGIEEGLFVLHLMLRRAAIEVRSWALSHGSQVLSVSMAKLGLVLAKNHVVSGLNTIVLLVHIAGEELASGYRGACALGWSQS